MQIISVAYAAVENVTASDTAIFDFGEDDAQIVETVKNIAKMRATQAENKQTIVQQNQSSQQNISKINNDFDNLHNSSENIEQITSKFSQIDTDILAQEKINEGNELFYKGYFEGAISRFSEAINLNLNQIEKNQTNYVKNQILKLKKPRPIDWNVDFIESRMSD